MKNWLINSGDFKSDEHKVTFIGGITQTEDPITKKEFSVAKYGELFYEKNFV